ncbi:MAG: FAD-dependent oxidoreductase [Sphingomonadaceae bacterium]|nr:FAD-dependent oxidoreductase [Sphingomonadaceae bacterium]
MTHRFPSIDRPIAIGGKTARNRIMMSTHGPRLPQARYLRYLEERAAGGIGIAGFNLGPLGVMQFPFGPGVPAQPSMDLDAIPTHPLTAEGRAFYDSMIPTVREWADAVKQHGVLAVAQLYHSGGAQHSDNFQPVVAPSDVVDEYGRQRPHPLTGGEISDLIEAYALCGRRALEAGYDAIELHGAHGYLIQQFLSPLTNQRTDEWGGSFDNRTRFLVSILEAVRTAVGDEIAVGLRLTGQEPEGGLTIEDLAAVAARAERAGAGYISVSGGTYSGFVRGANRAYVASALTPPCPNVPVSSALKRAVSIPVMVGGSISTLDQAEQLLAAGEADIVCMVRALVAEPHLVAKGLAGDDPRPCIGGNECHYGRPIICAVNPAAGREAEMEITPTPASRRVLVVGAGPAGIECALWAAARGHEVILAERSTELGGALTTLAHTSQQSRFADYLAHSARKIAASSIDLRLGTMVDEALARAIGPDVIVVASGAIWTGGLGRPALEALADPEALGPVVTVIGGRDDHLPPLIAAEYLARSGRQVSLLVEAATPGSAIEPASLHGMMRRLHELGVAIHCFTAATELRDGVLLTRNTLTNAPGRIDAPGDIVDADSRIANSAMATELAGIAAQLHVIGDALAPRRMLHATLDGSRLGLQIG